MENLLKNLVLEDQEIDSIILIFWRVDSLLGNAPKISIYETEVAK
jgi:hypothetical protein